MHRTVEPPVSDGQRLWRVDIDRWIELKQQHEVPLKRRFIAVPIRHGARDAAALDANAPYRTAWRPIVVSRKQCAHIFLSWHLTCRLTGGSPPRPGEISLAHHGVLFLDELPEFPRAALEALREPMETGQITISRAARRNDFPARFQLLSAMNPCPCGHHGNPIKACRCTPDQVSRYQARLSGPLLDRIDVQVDVPVVAPEVLARSADGESSAQVAARVARAREIQWARQGCLNALLSSARLEQVAQAEPAALSFLQTACTRLGWSGRAFHRVLKLARTIADLADQTTVSQAHVAEAIQYRRVIAQS